MTTTEAIQTLTEYAAWRRGAETEMIDPITIRIAIDHAIEVLIGCNVDAPEGECCPKCGTTDIITTIYCNNCNQAY